MENFLAFAPDGCVVEVGVYQGGSLYYLASRFPNRMFYGYDTFEGMPEACAEDNYHRQGDFLSSLEYVTDAVSGLGNVHLVKGCYPESDTIHPQPIALAHVDVDLYSSTLNSLRHLWPLITPGGRIYCDDAFVNTCAGATKAFLQFCSEMLMPHFLDLTDGYLHGYLMKLT
jgi:O-methyltransferase